MAGRLKELRAIFAEIKEIENKISEMQKLLPQYLEELDEIGDRLLKMEKQENDG